MCKYSLDVGDSFVLQDANGKHLHFIVAAESGSDHASIILVYMSSADTTFKDKTTIIRYGEHPFITDPHIESWIRYQNTRICSRAEIREKITIYYGKVSDELLEKIRDGVIKSERVKKDKKKLFLEWRMNHLYNS